MGDSYYKTKESVDEYIRLAHDANGQQLIDKLKNYLSPKSSLLEIGSGPGTDYKILNTEYDVVGSDFSTEFLSRLKSEYTLGEFLELDAITLVTDKNFDGIYSNKVLQHLSDKELRQSIIRQVEILNPEGIICHSFWKGEGDEIFNGLFVNYQTAKSLKLFFEKSFEILILEEYKEFEDGDSLLIIASKK